MAKGALYEEQYGAIISSIPGARVIDAGAEFPSLYAKAERLGLSPEKIMKTVYFEEGPIVVAAVLPITERVDTKALASEIGARRLSLAKEGSLPKGQNPGSLGPWIAWEEDWERVSKVFSGKGTMELLTGHIQGTREGRCMRTIAKFSAPSQAQGRTNTRSPKCRFLRPRLKLHGKAHFYPDSFIPLSRVY